MKRYCSWIASHSSARNDDAYHHREVFSCHCEIRSNPVLLIFFWIASPSTARNDGRSAQLGSPLVATDDAAKTRWSQSYIPYGEELDKIPSIDKTHTGYTGKPHDNDTDLSYYGARYYFPYIGRFISPDPAAVNPEMPITFNRYAYAANNPYKYVDPDGKEIVSAVVGGIIGGIQGWHDAGLKGALIGGGIGLIVGAVDPFASGAAAEIAVRAFATPVVETVAKTIGSAVTQTIGNLGYNKSVSGSFNVSSSIIGGFSGGIGGQLGAGMTKAAFAGAKTEEGILGNIFNSSAMQNNQSNISGGASSALSGITNMRYGNLSDDIMHNDTANDNSKNSNDSATHNNERDS